MDRSVARAAGHPAGRVELLPAENARCESAAQNDGRIVAVGQIGRQRQDADPKRIGDRTLVRGGELPDGGQLVSRDEHLDAVRGAFTARW